MTDLEIVQEAQKRIEEYLKSWQITDLWSMGGKQEEINSWLAHKAFFERHADNGNDFCSICLFNVDRWGEEVFHAYPCPELVAQAKAIMGVTE